MSTSNHISREQILENVEAEARRLRSKEPLSVWPPPDSSHEYEERLGVTIKELQARVDRERAALEQLKAEHRTPSSLSGPSSDESEQLRQTHALTRAYNHLSTEPPFLPSQSSLLPTVLALSSLDLQISDMKTSIPSTHTSLTEARRHLSEELADLGDNYKLGEALNARIAKLSSASSQSQRPAPEQTARRLVDAARTQSKTHQKETRHLTRALVRFIETDLGPKLAAEELGGPVAGLVQGVEEDDLVAGYAASGRPKKRGTKTLAGDKRQRKIDEIWGPPDGGEGDDGFEGEERTESEAAATEMRDLVESLLNTAVEGGSDYVQLERDSAAARFLVRSNVAVLHRADARRIRLVEFGRDVDS